MSNTVDIEVVTPVTAQAEIHKYTLVSDDIYVKRYDSFNVPDWYENMIHDIIDRNYNVNTTGDIIAFLSNLQEGYSQSLTTLKNKDEVINASLTSLITKSDVALAGIANLDITKISAADAQAISRDTVGAFFTTGNSTSSAWFTSEVDTYASATEANSTNIEVLSVVLDGQTVRIDTIDDVIIELESTTTTSISKLVDLEAARDGMIEAFYQGAAPSSGMSYGDYWVDIDSGTPFIVYRYENADGSSNTPLGWQVNTGEAAKAFAASYNAQYTADGKIKVHYTTLATRPILTTSDVGDMWVSSDIVTKGLTKIWEGNSWEDVTNTAANTAYTWSAKSVKKLTGADGSNMGFQLISAGSTSAPTAAERSFTIIADTFKVIGVEQAVWNPITEKFDVNANAKHPFTVNTTTGDISFNGKVSFSNIKDPPTLASTNTNINVTNNLVPTAGWQVGGYGDYQFYASPTYYRDIGAGTVAEDELLLNAGDEVYDPYIADMTIPYQLSYAFKGANIGSFITVIGLTPTAIDILPSSLIIDPTKWYIVQFNVLPNGTTATSTGFIREAVSLFQIANITDVVLPLGIEKFLMGFIATADTYISRVSITYLNSTTPSTTAVTIDNIGSVIRATTTTIDGPSISTGAITANQIDVNSITVDKLDFSTASNRNAFASIIGSAMLEYTTFLSQFFSIANIGGVGSVKTQQDRVSICIDDKTWFSVYRENNDLVLWVYGTDPSETKIGWNCDNSQGNTHRITYTTEEITLSSAITITASDYVNDFFHKNLGSTYNWTYSSFNDVPLYENRSTKKSSWIQSSGGSTSVAYTYSMLGVIISNTISTIVYDSVNGGLASKIGKEYTINFNSSGDATVLLPIGVYAVKPGQTILIQDNSIIVMGSPSEVPVQAVVYNTDTAISSTFVSVSDSSIISLVVSGWGPVDARYVRPTVATTIIVIKVG